MKKMVFVLFSVFCLPFIIFAQDNKKEAMEEIEDQFVDKQYFNEISESVITILNGLEFEEYKEEINRENQDELLKIKDAIRALIGDAKKEGMTAKGKNMLARAYVSTMALSSLHKYYARKKIEKIEEKLKKMKMLLRKRQAFFINYDPESKYALRIFLFANFYKNVIL